MKFFESIKNYLICKLSHLIFKISFFPFIQANLNAFCAANALGDQNSYSTNTFRTSATATTTFSAAKGNVYLNTLTGIGYARNNAFAAGTTPTLVNNPGACTC